MRIIRHPLLAEILAMLGEIARALPGRKPAAR